MADIELVTKIPEEYYKAIMKIPVFQSTADMLIIKNGTPLPKGHGRLIDGDEFHQILEDMPMRDNDKWFNWLQKACIRLGEMPTIIEADKAESEGEDGRNKRL